MKGNKGQMDPEQTGSMGTVIEDWWTSDVYGMANCLACQEYKEGPGRG